MAGGGYGPKLIEVALPLALHAPIAVWPDLCTAATIAAAAAAPGRQTML